MQGDRHIRPIGRGERSAVADRLGALRQRVLHVRQPAQLDASSVTVTATAGVQALNSKSAVCTS